MSAPATSRLTLDALALDQRMVVVEVRPHAHMPDWARWLDEIGFIVGESVVLLARALPGGDPLVVRVGTSTFALRRAEAACVVVEAPSGGL